MRPFMLDHRVSCCLSWRQYCLYFSFHGSIFKTTAKTMVLIRGHSDSLVLREAFQLRCSLRPCSGHFRSFTDLLLGVDVFSGCGFDRVESSELA